MKMILEEGRCLFALAILTGFLLSSAYGTTTEGPTTAPTTAPSTTPVQSTDSVASTELITTEPTTPAFCMTDKCQNGGTCSEDTDMCYCAPGFNGPTCQTEIDECGSNPCMNGGTCMDMVNGYNCTCLPGFSGTECETDIRDCNSSTCQNGGTCYDGTNYFNCSCAPGFNGTYCENTCPAGTYGDYCMEDCTCVEGANCSHVDGSCTCSNDTAVCDKRNLMVMASRMSDGEISEGDNFTLVCQVNLVGTDLDEVAWYRGDVKLPSVTNDNYRIEINTDTGMYNITILNAGAEDTGNYNCTAVTKGGQFTRSSEVIHIEVLVIGKIVNGTNDRVELNETAMLSCTAFSSEPLTLGWERNGQPLSTVNRTTVSSVTRLETSGGTFYSIILNVTGIVRSDNGSYQCIVMDQAGNETDRGDLFITVIEVPELSEAMYIDVQARKLIIGWDEFNVNAPTTTCTAFYNASGSNETNQMQFSNPMGQGVIEGLTPHTYYSVSLICQNEVGHSERLPYPDEKTLQDAPEAPTDVTVSDVTQTSANVRWVAPTVLNGDLVGYYITAEEQDCLDDCWTLPKDVGANTLTFKLTELSPGTKYTAIVNAYNYEKGRRLSSPNGRSDTFRTQPTLPGPPFNVMVDDNYPDHCRITWEKPQEPNGIIERYEVTKETYRLNSDSNLNTTTELVDDREWIRQKSSLPAYSDFKFSVRAINEVGKGNPSEKVKCSNPTVGVPVTPDALPAPSAISHYSFTTTLPSYSERNGPVSCYEVVVVQLENSNAVVNPDDDAAFSPGQVKQYKDRGIGVPYIAMVLDSISADKQITIGGEETDSSECNTGGSARIRRSSPTVQPNVITGVNGPLNPDGIYTSFVRVYSPAADDVVYYTNGPVMKAVTLNGQPPSVGGIVGGLFGVTIAICLVLVIMLLLHRRRNERANDDRLMTSTTNGRDIGNGTYPMDNLGIDHEPEVIVKPIKLENLERTIRDKAKDEKKRFYDEYKALPNKPPPLATKINSELPANNAKNRYINIIAYDHTRVKLKAIDGIEGSDYINASYVNGYQTPDKFIAAQGPKDNTIEDFWRMIWEYNCSTIVMLTKCVEDGKDKCSQYWPNKGSIKYGRFEVTLDTIKETAEYVIRSFFLSEDGKESGQRSITQFHFLGWPDHGQPDYPSPMMCLIKRVRHLTSKMNHRANIVVHCSAGVGRTGTYIVIDAMLDKMKHEKQVDIYNFIHEIRQQRNTLVQSFVQYFFIHIALLEEHLFGHTDVGMSDFPSYYQELSNKSEHNEDLTKLEMEFRSACKLGVNGTEQTFANIDQNKDKNRIGHILPFDKNIVKLERLIGEEFSDYINASYITGYERKNMYIATQGPLPNTIADFWRMIWESQTSTIVMLTEISQKGHEMCAQYWPLEIDETEEHGDISVTLVEESDEDEAFTIRDVEISHAHVVQNIYGNIDKEGEAPAETDDTPENDSEYGNIQKPPASPMKDIRKIRQYHFRGWPELGVPESGMDLLRVVNKSHLHQKEKGAHPIVVHCSAGAGRTGVFIALNILMSRMEEESMIDVFQTVRGLRQQRPHMVQDLAQYKFCYSAIAEYIESQSTEYQNFVPRV